MPDVVEDDPVGVGQPVAVARGCAGPGQEAVLSAPDDAHWAGDRGRIQAPARNPGMLDEGARTRARRYTAQLMGEELRRDMRKMNAGVLRGRAHAPGAGQERLGLGRDRRNLALQLE